MPWWVVLILVLLAGVVGFLAAVAYIGRSMFKRM